MKKLNFGCGNRLHPDWINIDFHSNDNHVQRVNLLNGFPFENNYFQVVYSSHVLEHFTREQSLFLLKEAYRVLCPGGILRIVLPDLENTCREYIRILEMEDGNPEKNTFYEWIMIELLDQLVRDNSGGDMAVYIEKAINTNNQKLINYIKDRTESGLQLTGVANLHKNKDSVLIKIKRRLSWKRVITKITYKYLRVVRLLIPKNIRPMVLIQTAIGERHKWMYDYYGIKLILNELGFKNIRLVKYNESSIAGFNADLLDANPDGTSYKNNSIYVEAGK